MWLRVEEVEGFARKQKVAVQFTKIAEAREYRETVAMRQRANDATQREATAPQENVVSFPKQLLVS
jgi:hypothetical protein